MLPKDVPWESCCSSCQEHPRWESRGEPGGSSNPTEVAFENATGFGPHPPSLQEQQPHVKNQQKPLVFRSRRTSPLWPERRRSGPVEQLTLLSLLVLGSVWLTCRSEYLGGFRKGLLISQGTDSVRTNLAGLRREREGKRGWRGGGERRRDIKASKEHSGSTLLQFGEAQQPPRPPRELGGGEGGQAASGGGTILFLNAAFRG